MERQEPAVSWEFAISTRLQPRSSAETTRKRQSSPKGCLNLSCASDNDGGDAQRCKRSRQSGGQRDRDPGRSDGETESRGSQGRRQDPRSRETDTGREAETQEGGATGGETSQRGGPEVGTGGPTAGQTDPPLPSRGLPISWANHPLRQQQQSRLIPSGPAALPLALPPPSLLQSSPLFKMSFCSCSPDSCSILEPALGQGGWILEGRMSSWRQGGMGMGGKERGSLDTPSPVPFKGS